MKTTRSRIRMPLLALMFSIGLWFGAMSNAAAAIIDFTFNDEYYINNLSTFNNVFGPGATGYSSPGIYEQTNTSSTSIARLSSGNFVSGEYQVSTIPDQYKFLFLTGWSGDLHNGQAVGNVSNQANPMTGTALYFRYVLGGLAATFGINSLDIAGNNPDASFSFTIEGLRNGNVTHSAVETVNGSTFTTASLNWQDVDAVAIVSTAALPLNWSSGVLRIDNVVLDDGNSVIIQPGNDPPANDPPHVSNPEPCTMLLMGLGSLGALIARKRFKSA